MILRLLLLVGALTRFSLSVAVAAAAPGTNPTADTFVSSANPGGNYGGAGALEVSAAGLGKGEFDTFARFNLSSTKSYFDTLYGTGNWTVQSISLQLTASNPNNVLFNANAAGSFSLRLLQTANANTWVEGTGSPNAPDTSPTSLNFNNQGNYLGAADQNLGLYTFAGGTSGASTFTLQLSSGLQAGVQAGGDVNFYLAAADAQVSYLFNSRSFGTVAARPTLVIDAVPEPGVGILLGAGAGLLALVGKRRGFRRS